MKSRVHPTYKTKCRVENWPKYDRALVRRGDVTIWLSPEAVATWEPGRGGTRGGQRKYSDLAIETALTLRLVFNLPLRQAEGFLRSLFGMMGINLSAPDHTTLSRRGLHLDVKLGRVPAGEAIHLIVDSTGLSIVGEGEWAAAKHGGSGKRGWRKLHLGVDGSGVIVAQVLTNGNADVAKTGLELINAIEGSVTSLTHRSSTRAFDRTRKTVPPRLSWIRGGGSRLRGRAGRKGKSSAVPSARRGRRLRMESIMQAENSTTDFSSFDISAMDTVPLAIGGGVLLLFTFAWIRIFQKAGYHWGMGLLMLVPVVNVIMMFVLAFGDWPVLRNVRSLREMEKSVESLSSQLPRRAA